MGTFIREVVAGFNDEALRQAAAGSLRSSSLRTVRDAHGELRELSETEREFTAAVRDEFRARFTPPGDIATGRAMIQSQGDPTWHGGA